MITAAVTATCSATIGANIVPLTVVDGTGVSATADLVVNVSANSGPTVGSYPPVTIPYGGGTTVSPATAPVDNGLINNAAASAPGFTGLVSADLGGIVTIANAAPTGAFTVTVTLSDNCGASTNRSFGLTVAKAAATVTLGNLTATYIGAPQSPTATTTPSDLSIVWTGAPATDGGDYPVTATVNDANYEGSASGIFTINKAAQTIAFTALGDQVFGVPDFAVSATSSSGLPVSFTASGACTLAGPLVHLVTAGPCTITALQAGNGNYEAAAAESHTFLVRDLMPPAVVVPADMTLEAASSAGAAGDFAVTATDNVDGVTPVSCSAQPLPVVPETPSIPVAPGHTFALGASLVTCTSADASGNLGTASFTITVADTSDPVLIVADITATATNAAGIAVEFAPEASDSVSGSIAAVCTPTSNTVLEIGDTTVSCTASDAAGNSVSAQFVVHVLDGVAPVVTAPEVGLTEATSSDGAVVTFAVTAADNISGELTPDCTPASGTTFAVGASSVHCFVADAAGNTGVVDFTVTITDTTAPALSLANVTSTATTGTGASVNFTATALDIVDGGVTPVCSHTSGATFSIGTTTVTCAATDAHHNASTGNFSVTVTDGVSPTVSVPINFTREATSDAGAAATFAATAADNYDAALTPVCAPASGSTFPLGVTTVNCTAVDAGGNTGTASFIITVVDTTAPALTLPSPIAVSASSTVGTPVTYTTSAVDVVDGNRPVVCTAASGATFQVGETSVACTTADSRGNTAIGNFTVTVTLVSSNRIGRFVAFSRDYTWLRENATVVTGDVGANERRYHNHQPVAEDDGREDVTLRVGQNAEVQQSNARVVGSTVIMANKSSVADVITNLLFNKRGTVRGTVTNTMAVPYLTLPSFPSVTPGMQAIGVAKKKTLTLPPGAYGDVLVDNSATLILTGGLYQFRSLTVAQQGTILLSGPSEVRVLRDLKTKARSRIILDQNVPGLSASQMVFYVAAADNDSTPDDPDDDGDDAGPVSVSIGQQGVVQAAIYAKNGTVWLRSKTQATGQFIGLHVRIGQRVTLTLATAFQ